MEPNLCLITLTWIAEQGRTDVWLLWRSTAASVALVRRDERPERDGRALVKEDGGEEDVEYDLNQANAIEQPGRRGKQDLWSLCVCERVEGCDRSTPSSLEDALRDSDPVLQKKKGATRIRMFQEIKQLEGIFLSKNCHNDSIGVSLRSAHFGREMNLGDRRVRRLIVDWTEKQKVEDVKLLWKNHRRLSRRDAGRWGRGSSSMCTWLNFLSWIWIKFASR